MKILVLIGSFLTTLTVMSQTITKGLPDKGILDSRTDAFFDPAYDYSRFPGRVTDRDKKGEIFKVFTENYNSRFFKKGDQLKFIISGKVKKDPRFCHGHIRSVEGNYFIMHVSDLSPCFKRDAYFRRGTILNIRSKTLALRVLEASRYRESLIKQRDDFLGQLNAINNFLWGFDQEKAKRVADFDRRILELKKQRDNVGAELLIEKNESIRLQKELVSKLDKLDGNLEFYRPTKHELLIDRWNMDHDQGLPVSQRPQPIKKISERSDRVRRWHVQQFE